VQTLGKLDEFLDEDHVAGFNPDPICGFCSFLLFWHADAQPDQRSD
jgi:hypothetical protein